LEKYAAIFGTMLYVDEHQTQSYRYFALLSFSAIMEVCRICTEIMIV